MKKRWAILRWACTLAVVLLSYMWLGPIRSYYRLPTGDGKWTLWVYEGRAEVQHEYSAFQKADHVEWSIAQVEAWRIPLWPVAAVSSVVACLLWLQYLVWRSRRALAPCPKCGYSLVGLRPGAPCPECGAKA